MQMPEADCIYEINVKKYVKSRKNEKKLYAKIIYIYIYIYIAIYIYTLCTILTEHKLWKFLCLLIYLPINAIDVPSIR